MRNWLLVFLLVFLAGCSSGGDVSDVSDLSDLADVSDVTRVTFDKSPRVNSEASVEVRVTPLDLGSGDWTFTVGLTTHSGDLGEDMMETAVLRTNEGKEFRPTSWEGSPPGGHHREGVLSFGNPGVYVSEVIVEIREVGGVEAREFRWGEIAKKESDVLGSGAVSLGGSDEEPEPAEVSVNVIAKQWSFEPSEIRVKKGQGVILMVKSVDVTHGFVISDFGVQKTLKAGEIAEVRFTADRVGTFSFSCNVYCGAGHGGMQGVLVVEE